MLQKLLNEVLAPLVRRLGSMGAGAAITYGANAEQVQAIEAGLVALGLLAVDLIASHFNRKGK